MPEFYHFFRLLPVVAAMATASIVDAQSAGGAAAIDSQMQRCPRTVGTVAVASGEDQAWFSRFTEQTQMSSVVPLLRSAILQSNCFQITSQGNTRTEQAMQRFQSQSRGQEFRASDKNGSNQRVASDYYLETTVSFGDDTHGGIGIPSIFGGGRFKGPHIGMKGKTVEVTLELYDVRAQVLIATATAKGKATSMAYSISGAVSPGSPPAAKAVADGIVTAYSQMVPAIINYRAQHIKGGAGNGGNLPVE